MDFKRFQVPLQKLPQHGSLKVTRKLNPSLDPLEERLFVVLPSGDYIVIDVVSTSRYRAELVITASKTLPIIRSEVLKKEPKDEQWDPELSRPDGSVYDFIEDRHEDTRMDGTS
jgi:hypothetical protein